MSHLDEVSLQVDAAIATGSITTMNDCWCAER